METKTITDILGVENLKVVRLGGEEKQVFFILGETFQDVAQEKLEEIAALYMDGPLDDTYAEVDEKHSLENTVDVGEVVSLKLSADQYGSYDKVTYIGELAISKMLLARRRKERGYLHSINRYYQKVRNIDEGMRRICYYEETG